MNLSGRASHPSRAQVEMLLDFMERNPSLAKGFSKVPSVRNAAHKLWDQLILQLNSLGGCVKTSKQWTKYWADKKNAVKKKGALRYQYKNGDGEEVVELSEIEERLLSLMGGESFAIGDRHLELNPFEETAHIDDNQFMLPTYLNENAPPPSTEQSPPCINMTEETPINQSFVEIMQPSPMQTVECVLGSSQPSARQGVVCIVSQSPPQSPVHILPNEPELPSTPPGSVSYPERHSANVRHRVAGSSRNCRPPIAAPSGRPSRKRRRPLSPTSQKSSHLASITERFLGLEESRLELDRRNSQILESVINRQAERDESIIRSLQTIGEGLKLLAEVLKK